MLRKIVTLLIFSPAKIYTLKVLPTEALILYWEIIQSPKWMVENLSAYKYTFQTKLIRSPHGCNKSIPKKSNRGSKIINFSP